MVQSEMVVGTRDGTPTSTRRWKDVYDKESEPRRKEREGESEWDTGDLKDTNWKFKGM